MRRSSSVVLGIVLAAVLLIADPPLLAFVVTAVTTLIEIVVAGWALEIVIFLGCLGGWIISLREKGQ